MKRWMAGLLALLATPAWAVDRVEVGELDGHPVLLVEEEPRLLRMLNRGASRPILKL